MPRTSMVPAWDSLKNPMRTQNDGDIASISVAKKISYEKKCESLSQFSGIRSESLGKITLVKHGKDLRPDLCPVLEHLY